MTVSSSNNRVSYAGNGSTTVFPYTYKIFDEDDLTVILRATDDTETVQTITSDYTVSGVGNAGGGNVTMLTAPATGETLVILREQDLVQELDIVPNDPFPSGSLEDALDKLTFMLQQHQEELNRSLKVSRTTTITSPEFTETPAQRANKFLSFDASGDLTAFTYLGVDATASELNTLDGITATTAQLNATADGYFLGDIDYLTTGTAATYTTPTGARALRVTAVGGGGGGGGVDGQGASSAGNGRAGAGGGVCVKFITSPAASYTYTIGAGGAGGAAGNNNGAAGGNTTFEDGVSLTLTANGGALGAGHTASAGNNFAVGAVGGTATGGDLNLKGVDGGSFHVVGGVMAGFSASGFAPGFGGNVSPSSTSGEAGNNGVTAGSGGTGGVAINTATNYAGGDGADGLIIVEVFY